MHVLAVHLTIFYLISLNHKTLTCSLCFIMFFNNPELAAVIQQKSLRNHIDQLTQTTCSNPMQM